MEGLAKLHMAASTGVPTVSLVGMCCIHTYQKRGHGHENLPSDQYIIAAIVVGQLMTHHTAW